MTTPKTSRISAPAATGWVGRVFAGLGITLVVVVGSCLSPGGTSAGRDWATVRKATMDATAAPVTVDRTTDVARTPARPMTARTADRTAAHRRRLDDRPNVDPIGARVPAPARDTPRVEPASTATEARPMIARLLARLRTGLEQWRGVVVTSAAR